MKIKEIKGSIVGDIPVLEIIAEKNGKEYSTALFLEDTNNLPRVAKSMCELFKRIE